MNRKPRILALLLVISVLTTMFGMLNVSAAAPTSLDVAAIADISDEALTAFEAAIAKGQLDIDGVAYGVSYPASLNCGSYSLTSEEYILMAASALYALKEGKPVTTQITYKAVTVKDGAEKNGTGTQLNQAQYLELAERVSKYGTTTGKLPVSFNRPTDGTNIYEGRMTVYSIGHLFAKVLASYATTGTLPATIEFKPVHMGDVEVTPGKPATPENWYTAVMEAATFVTNNMANNILPAAIPVGPLTVTPAQFQYLACKVVVGVNAGKTNEELTFPALEEPANPQGTATGKIYLADYVAMAQKIINWGDANPAGPNYSTSSDIGITNYYDVVHMYAKVLNFYKENNALPNYNTVIGWKGTVQEVAAPTTVPTTAPTTASTAPSTSSSQSGSNPGAATGWYADVIGGATYVVNFVKEKGAFPASVPVGSKNCTPAQYLYLAVKTVVGLNAGKTDETLSIPNYAEPSNPAETVTKGTITIAEVVTMAEKVITFMANNGQGPNWMTSSYGTLQYENGIHMFSVPLAYYAQNGTLPATVNVDSWFTTTGGVAGDGTFGYDYSAYSAYLVPTANCQSNNATIIAVAKTAMYCPSSQSNQGKTYANPTNAYEVMWNVMEYVNYHTSYDYYANTKRGAIGVWRDKMGNCCDMGHLINALARSLGIPARYSHYLCQFTNSREGHVWGTVYLPMAPNPNINKENGWIYADPVNNGNYLGYQTFKLIEPYSANKKIELPF